MKKVLIAVFISLVMLILAISCKKQSSPSAPGATATTAATATEESAATLNQSVRQNSASGGSRSQVAGESPRSDQPPLERAAEVPRVDLCAQCGPTDWRWDGRLWVCGVCETPARVSARRTDG